MELTREDIDRVVSAALAEDVGSGDATTLALVPEDHQYRIEPRVDRGGHRSTKQALAVHLEEKLVPSHPAGGPRREDHARDAVTSIHRDLHGMPVASPGQ